jgi:hypothetical protein
MIMSVRRGNRQCDKMKLPLDIELLNSGVSHYTKRNLSSKTNIIHSPPRVSSILYALPKLSNIF